MKIAINILGVLILAFVATAFDCGGGGGTSNSGNNVPDPSFTGALPCQKQVKSPKGVTICSANAIGADVPNIADQQLDDLFRIAQAAPNNYHACLDGIWHQEVPCFSTHGTYHVWLLKPADVCVSPGFSEIVYSEPSPNGYDETYTDDSANHWDKDPRTGHTLLCAAGMMETGGGQMKGLEWPGMAVVDAVDKMPIIRYEGEHNLLAQVDPDRFVATQYHYGTNGGHPILGDGPTSLKGAKRKAPAAHDDTPQVKDGDGRTLFLVK
jgi:hypothetical protein